MYSTIVYANIDYGRVSCHLKEMMDNRKITLYRLSHDADIKYSILKKYYDDEMQRYDAEILAKICFCLNCEVSSLLMYEK